MHNHSFWKLTKIILIIGVIIVLILMFIKSFQTLGGFNFNSFSSLSMDKRITIILSFWGLFATFGGAYLGAKVSGENAIKINKNSIKNEHRKNSFPLKMEIVNYIEDIQENTTRKLELKRFNEKKYI